MDTCCIIGKRHVKLTTSGADRALCTHEPHVLSERDAYSEVQASKYIRHPVCIGQWLRPTDVPDLRRRAQSEYKWCWRYLHAILLYYTILV